MSEYRHTPDSLAERLDELLRPGQSEQVNQDGDPLIQAAAWLASAPRPQMSAETMARIQAQVIQAHQIQRTFVRPRFPSATRWALVASFVLIVLFAGSIPSSLASVPGDFLYPVKQAVEQVELTFANSSEASAVTHLVHAERRSQEAAALLARGQFNPVLVIGAIEELSVAAQIVRSGSSFDSALKDDLERRTVIVNAQVNTVLALVSDATQVPDSTVIPLLTEIHATQDSGGLLLPTATPTAMPSPSEAPSTLMPTMTLTPIPSLTEAPSTLMPTMTTTPLPPATMTASSSSTEFATATPIFTPTPTSLPTNLIIEGPVQAINGNIIIIYEIEIELSPNDPLLLVIQVGDVIRIEGNFDGNIVIAILVEIVNVDVVINETGEIWRDAGNCSNPPPPWAPANGWRARCEGQQPGNNGNNSNNGNNGNRGNNGNNNNRGMGEDD
jgi:Domain of unknown function (DUF5667)